jgi:hypothetical protein
MGYVMKGGRQGKTHLIPKWTGVDGKQPPREAVIKPMGKGELEYNRARDWVLDFEEATRMAVMIKVPGKLFHRTHAFKQRRQKLDELDATDKSPNGPFHQYQKECIIWLRARRPLVAARDASNFIKTGKRHRDKNNLGNQLWDEEGNSVELIDPEFTDNGTATGNAVSNPYLTISHY